MKRKIDFDVSSMRASAAPEPGSSSSGSSSINPWTHRSYSSKYYEILQKRKLLPVYEFKDALEKAVKENQVVIVEGETGSGTREFWCFLAKESHTFASLLLWSDFYNHHSSSRQNNSDTAVSSTNVEPVWSDCMYAASKSGCDVYCQAC